MQQSQDASPQQIQGIIKAIDSGEPITKEASLNYINILESYECWRPCFRLLKKHTQSGDPDSFDYFIRLARIQACALDDISGCIDTAVSMVKSLGLSYPTIEDQVVPSILPLDAFDQETLLLESLCDLFPTKGDRVLCLERLCSLYEKKVHNERKLHATYERLIKLDPRNIKALRYLKLAFTQSNDWDSVVNILNRLMGVVTHKQELFRYAQELAAIYLYQLDNPKQAIAILEERCSESPLDGSMIHFDAYQRLGNIDGCIRVLHSCLINVEHSIERAIIHLKTAELEEQRGNLDGASADYFKAATLAPDLLEPLEGLIQIQVRQGKWSEILKSLDLLKARVIERPLIERIEEARQRVSVAMERTAQ